jgi:beta-galactosidase
MPGIFRKALIAAATLAAAAPALQAVRPVPFNTVLYGASYYWEYMPYERLEEDVRLMEREGINVVRLGESSWGILEPRDGEFDFAWLDRVIGRLGRAGIKVILGTPTYSIPAWLYKEHPEIQVRPLNQPRYTYGLRQMTDLTHPVYRRYAERIIRKLVGHFRDHPAVIGYQLDNETHPSGTADDRVQALFRDRLRAEFKTAEALNRAWGLNYWGQRLNDFDELPPRDGAVNPSYKLEWERFQQGIVTDFLTRQAEIVRELARPDQFITHDFCGGLPPDVDQPGIAQALDITAVNIYHPVQDGLDGEAIAFSGDLHRSLNRGNYLVTETNAQTTGWDSRSQFPPYDGQLRLSAFAQVASGANLVAYWHWHSLHYGQETYWKGVLGHDLEPGRIFAEVGRTASDLKRLGPELVNLRKTARVAILYSLDSRLALDFMPFDGAVDYLAVLNQMHRALYGLNVETDFVFPGTASFKGYELILVPPLYVASDALLERLAAYVKEGGHLLVSFKSGFCDEHSMVRWTRAPGPLREAAGFSYQEFSNLSNPLALRGDPFQAGKDNTVSAWAEMIVPETARPLASYEHPFFGKYAALTRNSFGKGTLTYLGTFPSDRLFQKILEDTLKTAGITLEEQGLPSTIRVRRGITAAGHPVVFYLNFGPEPVSFVYARGPGTELVSGRTVKTGERLSIGAWDFAVVKEQAGLP